MRPKARKRIGIVALVPISVLSVASLFSSRSAVQHASYYFFGLDTSYFSRPLYSNESAIIKKSSFASKESNATSVSPALEESDGNTQSSADTSFSACLLVMDDNFRLPEWLAYHYYVMNLRHVVVAVDPHSRAHPSEVLDRWRDRIRVDVWTNDTFVATRNCTPDMSRPDILSAKKDSHRCRQIEFYQSCARHLRAQNRTWTSFHDIDEYLVVASRANVSHNDLVQQPGAILKLIQRYASNRSADDSNSSARDESNWPHWFSRPCFTVPRVLLSAAEVDRRPEDALPNQVPRFVSAAQFDTLRYGYQATPAGSADGLAKSVIDVSRLPVALAVPPMGPKAAVPPGNAHRPFRDYCTHAWPKPHALPLVIHHYLGSWEAFSFRDDARRGGLRTFEKWKGRSTLTHGGINDDARGWMSGFVRMVGEEAARQLLQDAGLPPDYKKPDNETALWLAQT
jgi:Glycosyl transferase family 2